MIDPELMAALELMPEMDLTDPVAARAILEAVRAAAGGDVPGIGTLIVEDRFVPGWEGDPDVAVRIYRPKDLPGNLPGILIIHGGGFIIGSIETEHARAVTTAVQVGAVVVSVEYRLAPEHLFPAAVHDCFSALRFLREEASALGVDPQRLALFGTSAGGGLAAATALLARDLGGPALCFQMLHIPELDDRLTTASMRTFVDSPGWSRPRAVESWKAYLGHAASGDEVSPYAAPARATDLSGLPPAYISTAENDPLRDEGILYGLALLEAGVSVELHQFPGTFHGSSAVATAEVSKRALHETTAVLRRALRPDPGMLSLP